MSTLWLRVRIWAKVTLATVFGLYVLFFVYKNSYFQVDMWWLWFQPRFTVRLLPLLLTTFLLGVLTTILIRTLLVTFRQLRELRVRQGSEKLRQELADMQAKAAKLQTRPPAAPPEP